MKQRIKQYINDTLEKFTGLRIQNARIHGRQDWVDIKNSGRPVNTILDVGANIGQSAIKFNHAFPHATIHCFEPVVHINRQLTSNVKHLGNVHVHSDALGAEPGQTRIYLTTHESMSSLIKPDYVKNTQDVNVITVDDFVQSENIDAIGLLKIDVEGFDLEVLKGAKNSFGQKAIEFVLVECGFYADASHHVSLDSIRDFLLPFDYRLFGIYDQQLAWSGPRTLRYVNACFIACQGPCGTVIYKDAATHNR